MSPPQPRGSSLGTNSIAYVPGSACKVLQSLCSKNVPSHYFLSRLPPYPMNCLLILLVAVHRLGLRPPPFFMYVFPAFVNSVSYDPYRRQEQLLKMGRQHSSESSFIILALYSPNRSVSRHHLNPRIFVFQENPTQYV